MDRSFSKVLYSKIFAMIGLSDSKFSRASALVENPEVVFLTGVIPSLSNKIPLSCFGELRLNSSPASL